MKILDISIQIKSGMTVYPNNPTVVIEAASQIAQGASSDVSRISFGSHTGTHVDAPKHATLGASGIKLQKDGYTYSTTDGSIAVQYEHTVAITEKGPVILTK